MAKKTKAESLIDQAALEKKIADLDSDARVRVLRKQINLLRKQLDERSTGQELNRAAFEDAYGSDLDVKGDILVKDISKSNVLETAVAHLSDVHFAKLTESYDMAKAEERVRKYASKVIECSDVRAKFARIGGLHVYLGGDMVEGDGDIFPGQPHEMETGVLEQVIKNGPEIVADAVLTWLKHFTYVKVVGVPGNHGRLGRHKDPRFNYDSVFYDTLKRIIIYTLSPKDRKRITFDLPFDRHADHQWYAVDTVEGWGNMLVHGDQISGGFAGFPWYGFGKKVAGWSDHKVIGTPWQYLYAGHFHTMAKFVINSKMVLANGTTESSNSYAAQNMAASGDPVQRLTFYTRKHGMVCDQPIYLESRSPVSY